jgi:S1-C subfamily serine protease
MNDPQYSFSPPPPSNNRMPLLLTILAALVFVTVLPYVLEQANYAMKRGELRAEAETAAAELAQLGAKAELVTLSDTSRAFRLVARRVEPSVVHINTEGVKIVKEEVQDEYGFRVPLKRGERMSGQGSGVVVDAAKGYVVTNFHVIRDAAAVSVTLADGRRIDQVRIVGYDVLTDLAVLQIAADKLISAEWGDSDNLEVGDWVLAIGNPYGLDRTVTSGIVSAKQRRGLLQRSPYQDFLQTDAAVNPGNSGGPLVNIRGEIVGINTAIVGQSFQGISFAIPSVSVRDIYNKLIAEGKVARAWLGVGLDLVDDEVARKTGLELGAVVVTRVVPTSPAALAGLQPGDILISWDGAEIVDPQAFTLRIGQSAIGSKVPLVLKRDGRTLKTTVTLGQRPDDTYQLRN